jgi:hypothetical protein
MAIFLVNYLEVDLIVCGTDLIIGSDIAASRMC